MGGPFMFSIVDLVQVPKDIPAGLYALSHRYDCEQTTQVWNTCANILIVEANDTRPDGHLIPDGPSGLEIVDSIMERLAQAPVDEGSCPVDIDQGHRYDDPKPLAVTQGMLRQPIAANSSHADDRQPTPRQQLTP